MYLQEYLSNQGLTQSAFASMIGISRVQVNRLIKGKRAPSLKVAKRIERVTGGLVTTDDYLIEDLMDETPRKKK